LDEFARDKSDEHLVQIRVHQLALAKVTPFFEALLTSEKDSCNCTWQNTQLLGDFTLQIGVIVKKKFL